MEFQTKKYNISPIISNYGIRMPIELSPVIQEQQESLKSTYNESAKEILRTEFTAMSEKEDRFVSRLTHDKSFHKPFIEANTTQVDLEHLKSDCIIPVFSKDNERTIAHQEFIDTVLHSLAVNYSQEMIAKPEIRVSHQIKGRIPEAIHKNAKDLLEHEKTIYYERMAFIIQIPSIVDSINGNELALTVGGVRSYSLENLYHKKSPEKFKFFIGFQNMVCCNLCVISDGYVEEMKVFSPEELFNQITEVIKNYNAERH